MFPRARYTPINSDIPLFDGNDSKDFGHLPPSYPRFFVSRRQWFCSFVIGRLGRLRPSSVLSSSCCVAKAEVLKFDVNASEEGAGRVVRLDL